MIRLRSLHQILTVPFVFLVIVFFNEAACAEATPTAAFPAGGTSMDSVNGILAGLSDEQVRQMLIEELRKESPPEESLLEDRVEGPGAPLSKLLKNFDSNSIDFENQFNTLLPWIPHIPADLYKVFITL
ncbi:MAG: hypothetical protein ACN4GW_13905 [Desulforhopalus sp.]